MVKVAIVDDSEEIRESVIKELRSTGNYDILTAEDGLLGLEVIKNNQDISLIITDINMPNMNGIEMLEALHKEKICLDTPKIVLTTETMIGASGLDEKKRLEKLFAKGKEFGVEAWVPKGAKVDSFMIIQGVIKRVLRKKKISV